MVADELADFDKSVPEISEFGEVADAERYLAVPATWLVGTSDVVNSTGAIAAGRYKAVNMVGAAVIAALRNGLGTQDVPFVFGGDGASFVIPESARPEATAALAAVSRWAAEEMDLTLRTALVSIEDVRAAGVDVSVAKFKPSPDVGYTMFSGGGMAWTDAQMKSGAFAVAPAPPGTRPDLTSLSCRWQPIKPRRGMIASLLVARRDTAALDDYRQLVRDVIGYIHDREIEEGRPISEETARIALSPQAISLETRAIRSDQSYPATYLRLIGLYIFIWFMFITGRQVGDFDPNHYRRETVRNTDFRKFDDGLKLTIDCSRETFDGLTKLLDEARVNAIADYGLHAQDTALMTCIVPSHTSSDHMHFVDGAGGGYAKAAEMLKAQKLQGGED